MDKIKKFICKFPIIDFVVLAVIITVFCFLFSNHLYMFIADKGREFLFPEEILNGNVPYKDIMLIYFPTAYYINAFIYKVLGVSINSLLISQGFLSIIYVFLYYLFSRMFLERKTTFLLSVLIICCCIFSYNDLFSFISPYSYARAYGIATFTLCTFLLIKLLKTDKIIYLYLAALLSGLCFIFKFEFITVYLLLSVGLFLYKKLPISQYIKVFLLSLLFPVLLLVGLFWHGVSTADLFAAAEYGYKFSKTAPMTLFLTHSGVYLPAYVTTFKAIGKYLPNLIMIILLCFVALKLNIKYSKPWIIPVVALYILRFLYDKYNIMQYWVCLPVLVLFVLAFKYKELFRDDKAVLLLIISSLFVAQRSFFFNSLFSYGIFAMPLLFLTLFVIIKKFVPPVFYEIKTSDIVNFVVVMLIGLYSINLIMKYDDTHLPITSEKGTIYTDLYDYDIINRTIEYIKNKTDKDDTILVLPEGHIINFLTDRKTNLKCHMMDRLYHDAYGERKAKDMIVSAKADYIILIEGVRLNDFDFPYLYRKGESLSGEYIQEHYTEQKSYVNKLGTIKILKMK